MNIGQYDTLASALKRRIQTESADGGVNFIWSNILIDFFIELTPLSAPTVVQDGAVQSVARYRVRARSPLDVQANDYLDINQVSYRVVDRVLALRNPFVEFTIEQVNAD